MPDMPKHLQIVADIRARIISGELAPGARVPSVPRMQAEYGVSSTVARTAMTMLQAEGLITRRRGSGTYVRDSTRMTRRAHARNMRRAAGPSTSPFARDAAAVGLAGSWEHHSEHTAAGPDVARRLGVDVGAAVMHTRYRFLSGGQPIQLSDSYEPLEVTGGTAVEWPEDGAAVGVVARMDHIGVRVDRFTERLLPRPATPDEVEALDLNPRSPLWVLAIERTYFAEGRAVETADIVLRADRYEVVYEVPVD